MAINITERRYSDDDLQLPEPHFDEEATMLSARPVVPLTEITDNKAEAGSKRHLAFGLSIVASLIIGIVGATLVLRPRGQKPVAEVVESAVAGSGATSDDSALPSSSTGEVRDVAGSIHAAETFGNENAQAQTAASVKQQESHADRTIGAYADSSKFVSRADERALRRAERIEARRLRRLVVREEQDAGGRGPRRSDDLFRIPEIFEGRRRP